MKSNNITIEFEKNGTATIIPSEMIIKCEGVSSITANKLIGNVVNGVDLSIKKSKKTLKKDEIMSFVQVIVTCTLMEQTDVFAEDDVVEQVMERFEGKFEIDQDLLKKEILEMVRWTINLLIDNGEIYRTLLGEYKGREA